MPERLDLQESVGHVLPLVPLADKLTLVRCGGCGAEFEDFEAAIHSEGYSEKGCPNQCRRLTTPVYMPDPDTGKWRRARA
jgi:hypothetical protein